MITTIDGAGRIVVPKAVRDQVPLTPGTRVDIRYRDDGVLEVEPVPLAVKIERRGRFLVAVPEAAVPGLSARAVEKVRRGLRRDRGAE